MDIFTYWSIKSMSNKRNDINLFQKSEKKKGGKKKKEGVCGRQARRRIG